MSGPTTIAASTIDPDAIVVIGAGVIGSAIALALVREGHRVVLVDRDAPGATGASYGNAGHVATELVEPLPSPDLVFGFWRRLTAFGGVLDVPARRLPAFAPWAWRFARAAFRRQAHTALLAPFVRPAVPALAQLLSDAGRPDLMRQQGHYEVWMRAGAARRAQAVARTMERLQVPTQPAPVELLAQVKRAAGAADAAGLWFPGCAHVLDPLGVVQAFVEAGRQRGLDLRRGEIRALRAHPGGCELIGTAGSWRARGVVVCAGAWSAPLLTPLGLRVPLEAARGYHVQSTAARALVDAPLLYGDHDLLVTPMAGRLRATSYMEFAGLAAPLDARKPARLRRVLRALGYDFDDDSPAWVGPRPVLPDYLPALGRSAEAPWLYYAFGHQHIGLTLSAVTARAIADLVAGRSRPDLDGFDLRRFR